MSQVFIPQSGSGSGVSNPLTADLDGGGYEITNVLTATTGTTIGTAALRAGTELHHADPGGVISFFGVPTTGQSPPLGPFVGADPVQNEQAINDLISILQSYGLIA